MRSWGGARESRCRKGQRGAELARGRWACCSSSPRGASSRMGSSRHGYREGHDSPSSFLSTSLSPKNLQKMWFHWLPPPWLLPGVTARQLLLDSGWVRGRRGGRQRREAKAAPGPWAGQGLRGLVVPLVLSNSNSPTLTLGPESCHSASPVSLSSPGHIREQMHLVP